MSERIAFMDSVRIKEEGTSISYDDVVADMGSLIERLAGYKSMSGSMKRSIVGALRAASSEILALRKQLEATK